MKKLLFLILIFSITCNAQFSKTHYIPPISASINLLPQDQYLYISCPSITPITFTITQLGGTIISGTVSRDLPYSLNIGQGYDTQLIPNTSEISSIMSNKGFIVEANDLVYVTVRVIAGNSNQAGGIVSKGLAALGTKFRIGAFMNTGLATTNAIHHTFASILATENNTTISFGDIKSGVQLLNNIAVGNTPTSIVLNRGQSYVYAAQGPTAANKDGLIGSFIQSDKPIAVNCGSFGGSNGTNTGNLDLGFDQIVSAERTGKEYIFIKGNGIDIIERPMIVSNVANTKVYSNGNTTTPIIILAAGEYYSFSGTDFSPNGNLYVTTSENAFAYQGIGGSSSQANQNMHFLPPISCQTPKVINNIPLINQVGSNNNFGGTVCVFTTTGATLTFIVNGTNHTLATLPATVSGPFPVIGAAGFVTYRFDGLTGNISVFSTKQIYLSYFGTSGAATYGGFYSGFTFNPEVAFSPINIAANNCVPNVELAVNSLSSFDAFQWSQNGVDIPGETNNEFTPTVPGFYKVVASITECGITKSSDEIPVSGCAADTDNDNVNDNVDLDNDNDGIKNCDESFGNQNVNLVNPSTGNVTIQTYNNTFLATNTFTGTNSPTPFFGNADGSFVSEVLAGKLNSTTQNFSFATPISLSLEYPPTAVSGDFFNANGEFTIQVPLNKTITVLNPNDQLLIDTNYDGIYESGITTFSSFQIRYRLNNGGLPLAAGTGTFKFLMNLVTTFSYKHKNLSETAINRSTFKLIATCVPKDSDGDGIADQNDKDSDNDGITDIYEQLGGNYNTNPFVDINKNGINDSFEALVVLDTDLDGVPNYLDLDADNDGIYDITESGNNSLDTNNNGVLDEVGANFGTNGLLNSLENPTDSGIINYVISNLDASSSQNFVDLDSDGDGCDDVREAQFSDSNTDGILGNNPVVVNTNGVVTSASNGYTTLTTTNYQTPAPIIITTIPANTSGCEAGSTTFSIISNAVTSYQWQLSTDNGTTFINIANIAPYSGTTTNNLLITNATTSMNNYLYRVFITKIGNGCNYTSNVAVFTVLPRPIVTPSITMVQCDTDLDLIADFNLTQKNNVISANAASETLTYYTTADGALNATNNVLINNPIAFNSPSGATVYVRIVNSNGCFNVSQINLVVSSTQLPPNFSRTLYECDDFLNLTNNDYDKISTFNFSSITADILAILPTTTGFSINYYPTLADFNAETNAISQDLTAPISIYNYRNIVPNNQIVYIRVESTLTNSCYGDGKIFLNVENLPIANSVSITRQCDDNATDSVLESAFNTSNIQSQVLGGQSLANVDVTYFDQNNVALSSPLPNPFTTTTQLVRVRLTNKLGNDPNGKCFDETFIQFTVDKKPVANTVVIAPECDVITSDNEVKYNFNTTNITSTVLGLQNPADFNISYFAEDGTALGTSLPNPFFTTTQKIKVVLVNPLNRLCPAETFIQFTVNELPLIETAFTEYICSGTGGNLTLNAGLIAGNQIDYSYQWFKNNVILTGETNYSYDVSIDGIYKVTVTNITTGCSRDRINTIIFSEKATITDIKITDLYQDDNTVIVTATGAGTYEYSIDEPDGPFQPTGVFNNIEAGFHTVYVNDKKGCGIEFRDIAVIGIMKVFTPNGDSYNDFWKIRGVSDIFNKQSTVNIFDRYGKLIKEIPNGQNEGWDGTLNGEPLPADDYWYSLVLKDGRTLKGHFALKR